MLGDGCPSCDVGGGGGWCGPCALRFRLGGLGNESDRSWERGTVSCWPLVDGVFGCDWPGGTQWWKKIDDCAASDLAGIEAGMGADGLG